MVKTVIAGTLAVLLALPSDAPALPATRVAYVSGTVARFNHAGARVDGRIDTSRAGRLVFVPDDKALASQALAIRYSTIRHLEFRQDVARRPWLAVAATTLLGPVGLPSLASKQRAHYLTVVYGAEDGTDHVAVFELGKRIARDTLATVERQSGIDIECEDVEAREWIR